MRSYCSGYGVEVVEKGRRGERMGLEWRRESAEVSSTSRGLGLDLGLGLWRRKMREMWDK